jgi:hypothetical protein
MAIGTVAAARASANLPVASGGSAGSLKVAWGTYNIAAAPADGDIIQMCRTPAGATILDVVVYGEDIDTGTEALDFDAGYAANGVDAADPDAWGNFGVITGDAVGSSEAGVRLWGGGVLKTAGPKTLTVETLHQIEFNVAANAGGTGRLTMYVLYTSP